MMIGSDTLKEFASQLRQIWGWWTAELESIYGSIWLFSKKQPLKIDVDLDDNVLSVTDPEAKNLNKKNVHVCVPAKHVMYKAVRLPLNTRNNIKQVVEYEFDKYFPLTASDAYFGCKILKSMESNSLNVGIWAIRKNYLDNLIKKMQIRFDLSIYEATIINSKGESILTTGNIKGHHQYGSVRDKSTIPYYGYIVTALVLLCLLTPLLKMKNYNEQLMRQIGQLEEEAKDVIAVKDNISEIEDSLVRVINNKKSSTGITALWSELTNIIAGNGYVNHVRFHENKVNIEGKANSVEKIVKLLEQNTRFTEISIDAPVRRLEQGRFESMSISFKVNDDN